LESCGGGGGAGRRFATAEEIDGDLGEFGHHVVQLLRSDLQPEQFAGGVSQLPPARRTASATAIAAAGYLRCTNIDSGSSAQPGTAAASLHHNVCGTAAAATSGGGGVGRSGRASESQWMPAHGVAREEDALLMTNAWDSLMLL
jgi:hypothetical protein